MSEPSTSVNAPSVTVVVCTRNRADRLSVVLESFADLVIPSGLEWEVLVVDNGSTDPTKAVAEGFAARLPLRYVVERRPGLSHARNRGVAEARGDYICWTDDDVVVDQVWLASYVAAFLRHPEAAIFGGKILPELEAPTPRWFTDCIACPPVRSVMVFRDMGEHISPITQEGARFPWGANYALRRTEQLQAPYDPELGHAPHHRRVGEESDVIYRLMAAGATGWWVPGCVVRHALPSRRQSLREILKHFHAVGETFAYIHDRSPGHNWNELHGPPRFRDMGAAALARLRLRLAARFAVAWLKGDLPRALGQLSDLGLYSGVASYRRGGAKRSAPLAAPQPAASTGAR